MKRAVFVILLAVASLNAQEYTRGVGIYPGDPKEDFAPAMRVDATSYRNLALRRPAFHSSAYDYNLTAQLVTDGIKDTKLPRWVSASTSNGPYRKFEREWMFDNNPVTSVNLRGPSAWVQVELPPTKDNQDQRGQQHQQEHSLGPTVAQPE